MNRGLNRDFSTIHGWRHGVVKLRHPCTYITEFPPSGKSLNVLECPGNEKNVLESPGN